MWYLIFDQRSILIEDWGSILIGVGFRGAHGVRYNSGRDTYLTLESTIESIRIYLSHKQIHLSCKKRRTPTIT